MMIVIIIIVDYDIIMITIVTIVLIDHRPRFHPHLDGLAEHLKHAHAVVQLVAPRCEHPQRALRELLPG